MYNFGAIGQGVEGVGQGIYGMYQWNKGLKDMDALHRPEYQIPTEIQDKLTASQRMAMEGLPAEQKQQYVNNLQRSSNFGLNALSDRKAGLTGVSTLVQNQDDGYNNLLAQDSAARMQNQRRVGDVQSEMAGYKDKQWELNTFNPYLQKYQDAKALIAAGTQNTWSGFHNVQESGGKFFGASGYGNSEVGNGQNEKGLKSVQGNEDMNTGMYQGLGSYA